MLKRNFTGIKRTGRRSSSTLLCTVSFIAMLGVAEGSQADQTENVVQANAKFKLAIIQLVAGTYGQGCSKEVGDQMLGINTGSPMLFEPSGDVKWGSRTDHLTSTPSSIYSLSVNRADVVAVDFRVDLEKPAGDGRLALYDLQTTPDGRTSAMVTVDALSPALGNACDGPKPSVFGKRLWGLASHFIAFSKSSVPCFDSKSRSMVSAPVAFSAGELSIGPLKMKSTDPTKGETLDVGDESYIGFSYSVTRLDGSSVTTEIHPDGSFKSMMWSRPDGTALDCEL